MRTEVCANFLLAFLDGANADLRLVKIDEDSVYPEYPCSPCGKGRLVQDPLGLRDEIQRLGFFDLVAETDYHPIAAWVVFAMAGVIDWQHSPGFFY